MELILFFLRKSWANGDDNFNYYIFFYCSLLNLVINFQNDFPIYLLIENLSDFLILFNFESECFDKYRFGEVYEKVAKYHVVGIPNDTLESFAMNLRAVLCIRVMRIPAIWELFFTLPYIR